jgi:amino acid adenylation domain-containing protein
MTSTTHAAINLSAAEKRAYLAQMLRRKASSAKRTEPLSYGQKALWFLHRSAPESAAYHVAFTVRIRSDIDIAALRRALQKLLNRHDALRTTFELTADEPVRQVAGYQEAQIELIDTASYSWEVLREKVIEAYQRPYVLEWGPLLRASLFSRSGQDHILLLTIHHIVFDAWSLWILQDELQALYVAECQGRSIQLPNAQGTYGDLVRWQSEMLAGPQGEEMFDYWRKQLAGAPSVLDLPLDRPRPPVQTYSGAAHEFRLEPALSAAVKTLAQAAGVTPFTLLLAIFQVLLYRYSGQQDILVGSPTSGRTQEKIRGVIGYFVNPVVLRANMSGNPSFQVFLEQVRVTVLNALAHQDYPFPLLVERLQPKRDPSYSPLFQVSFVLQQAQSAGGVSHTWVPGDTQTRMQWGGLEVQWYDLPQQLGQFDLELEMLEARGAFHGIFKYSTDLFDAATIGRMAGHFQALLQAVVDEPDQCIDNLSILTPAERTQILQTWNQTEVGYPDDVCLHELVEMQVERTPDAIALEFEDQHLTYRELNGRANRLAHYLISRGVGPDVMVGICAERSVEMVVGLLGIQKAGGAYVPLDPSYPRERLAFMIDDAQVPVLLTQQKWLAEFPETTAELLSLDDNWARIATHSSAKPALEVGPKNLAYVIYTSGSTGKPKGAMNSHRAICNRLLWMQDAYRLTPSDRVLQKTPFSFDVSVWEFFWPLLSGARMVLAKPGGHKDGAYLVDLIMRRKITTLHFVPPMLEAFLNQEGIERCSSLRRVICSGEALPYDLQERFFSRSSAELHNLYGPTEAAIDVSFWECQRNSPKKIVPIGRPIANIRLHILDRHLQPVPIGVAGELHIGGVGLANGYHNRPQLTAEKFIPDPFRKSPGERLYKTGDLTRYLADGTIEYLGRIDHQVKIRGFRIELGELEATLVEHPEVRASVVIVREDKHGDRFLVAYVVGKNSPGLEPAALRQFLKNKLPDYAVPSRFMVLDSLPLTPNGKVDRRALPEPISVRAATDEGLVAPRDPLEARLCALWEEVLDVRPVGIRDDFFELGGHSLRAVRLMALIEQEFGRQLPLANLFQGATIEQLIEVLRQQQGGDTAWRSLVVIQPGDGLRPIFCVPGGGGNVLYFRDLAEGLQSDRPFYGLQAVGLDGETPPFTRVEEMAAHNLAELQSVQPQGPYLLAGHCFGGLVAFEMAQQLKRQGQEVSMLALFDVPAPQPLTPVVPGTLDDAIYVVKIAASIEQLAGIELGISYENLTGLTPEGQLNRLKDKLQEIGFLPPNAQTQQVRGLVQVAKANHQVRYWPGKVLPVPITLFRAAETHPDYDYSVFDEPGTALEHSTLGWQGFTAGEIQTRVVPGNHITMMGQPHVQALGRELALSLQTAETGDEAGFSSLGVQGIG